MFKVGDRVRCTIENNAHSLKLGHFYVIEAVGNMYVTVEGIDEQWAPCRFELIQKPHKHAKLIKAWADGYIIQHKFTNGIGAEGWMTVSRPEWNESTEYRIKPEPKPDVVKYGNVSIDKEVLGLYLTRTEHSTTKVTFDGETGKLKAVEILG